MADHATLARLLGPEMPPSKFFAEYWDKQPLLLHNDGRPATSTPPFDGLLTLEDMDELLMRARLPGSQAELLLFEDLVSTTTYATPHMAFACGASIILNHTDKVWPPANLLCTMLGHGFRYSFANLYFTPNNSQTAPPHSDDRDVFILQLHGRKHWRVWPTPHELAVTRPFSDEQAGKDQNIPQLKAEDLGAADVDVTLEPGAILYIPRGCLHVADTTEADTECSLHLTIAIPTADLCLGGFVMNAVRSSCFGLRSFRQSLPLGPLPGGAAAATSAEAKPSQPAVAAAPSLRLQPAPGGSGVRLNLAFGRLAVGDAAAAAATAATAATASVTASATAAATAAAPPPPAGPSAECDGTIALSPPAAALDDWREHFEELWGMLHQRVRWRQSYDEVCVRMANHRSAQREALDEVEDALREGRRRGLPDVVVLLPGTRMTKIVPLKMIRPSGELGGKRVAQATPRPGGPGRHKYIHTPAELLEPLEAFEAMPLGCEFAVAELPGRHSFMRACACRALMGLGVVAL